MKKTYLAPVMDIEKFDVADIITASGDTPSTTAEIQQGAGGAQVEIVAQW